ncbi:hypothetical protein KSP39_PZI003605 [Platanthera zijinensis]|uniref:Wall-associated receptor kinase galacturonan-binding domain-containing protein n=1 Tax=Platanthera zijinensis TaxID=2320716 RepID=A0AAP0BWN3_9ASPA
MGKQSSSPSPSVIHCFIFFISIGFTEELPDQQHCNPSSCGEIQIAYPFRLKGDPQNCGDPNYELTCSGNRAFMEFHSSQYSVKQINYDSKSIQVIEIGLLRSNCSLPLKSLSATSMLSSNYYHLDRWTWIGIMNCSKKLLPQKYQLFPCQSRKDSYLYGVWGYLLIDLAPSCSFFSMMPTSDDLSVQKDLFQAIHEGFSLSWNNQGFTTAMLIRECLRQSSRTLMAIPAGALSSMKFDMGFDIDFDSFQHSDQIFKDILQSFKELSLKTLMSTRMKIASSEIREWVYTSSTPDADTMVGSISVFKYNPNQHDLAMVDRLAYETCGVKSNEATIYFTGNDQITLPQGNSYFFSPRDQGACFAGLMRLAITAE